MTKDTTSKQVAIAGVSVFDTPEERAEQKRGMGILAYFVGEGAVYATGLDYPPPGILPVGSSAVQALAITDSGEVYGATSGKEACLFWMPRALLLVNCGVIPGVRKVCDGLVIDGRNVLYGAAVEPQGMMFSYKTDAGSFATYRNRPATIEVEKSPLKDEGIATLALSCDKKVMAGIGAKTGTIFLKEISSGAVRQIACISKPGEAYSKKLFSASDHYFYMTGLDGELVRVGLDGEVENLGCHIPSKQGKAFKAQATAWMQSRSGRLYGGTEDGYLFSYNLFSGDMTGHGRPSDIPDLHCLAETPDGMIYGIVGRGRDIAHMVRFDPVRAEWKDLGLIMSFGPYPRTAYQLGAMVVGKGGELVIGENDRQAHMYIYHPPMKCSSGANLST